MVIASKKLLNYLNSISLNIKIVNHARLVFLFVLDSL